MTRRGGSFKSKTWYSNGSSDSTIKTSPSSESNKERFWIVPAHDKEGSAVKSTKKQTNIPPIEILFFNITSSQSNTYNSI